MTSLCGVWCCSNTIFYGQYPTQVKEELFLNDILCLKGRSFFAFTSTRNRTKQILRCNNQANERQLPHRSESIKPNDNDLELNAIAYTFSKIDSSRNFNTEYASSFGDRELLAFSSEADGETEKKNTFSAVEDSTLLRWHSGTQKRVGRTKQKDQIDNETTLFWKSIVKTKPQ